MTDLDITGTRKLADAAEAAPWRVVEHPSPDDSPDGWPLIVITSDAGREIVAVVEDDVASASETPRENAEFIARARTALPNALNEIERLRAKVAAMQDLVDAARRATGTDGVDEWNELVDTVEQYDAAQNAEAVSRG